MATLTSEKNDNQKVVVDFVKSAAAFEHKKDHGLGYVPFETFIEIIKEQAERFDGANIIFEGLSMEALQKIVETAV